MSPERKVLVVAAIYGAGAVVTFGHAAAGAEPAWNACASPVTCQEVPPGLAGFIAATVWPLYWSWEAQS
jgi:hypothetical protein